MVLCVSWIVDMVVLVLEFIMCIIFIEGMRCVIVLVIVILVG